MWENNFKWFNWQGLNLWIMQTTYTTTQEIKNKKKSIQWRNGKKTWIYISPKKIYKWLTSTLKNPKSVLINREMEVKTTEIITHTTQNGHSNEATNKKCWSRCGEKGTLLHCWLECKLVQPLWKTVWRFLQNPHIELPYDPGVHFLASIQTKFSLKKTHSHVWSFQHYSQ